MGTRVRARVVKNKVAPPFRVAEFDIMFNEGISREGDIVDLGTEQEVLTKSGAFYSFGETRLGQGRENAKAFLREHTDMAGRIQGLIMGEVLPEIPAGEPPTNGATAEAVPVAVPSEGG